MFLGMELVGQGEFWAVYGDFGIRVQRERVRGD